MLQDRPFSEFGGVAGRVLGASMSPLSFVSGLVVGGALFAGLAVLAFMGAESLAVVYGQLVVAFALVRFALNGLHGEWSGTIFSSSGGGLPEVGAATLRYLALSAVLLIPGMIIGPAEGILPALVGGGGGSALLVLWAVLTVLAPPVFLIMSVTVDGFGGLVSPEVWRAQFGGRLRDLFSLYVVYVGALAMATLLSLPVLSLAFAATPRLGIVVAGVVGCLLFGLAMNLAGRLCGFFACGELGIWDGAAPVDGAPATPHAAGPAAAADTGEPTPPADADPVPADATVAVSVPLGAVDTPAPAADPSDEATRVVATPAAGDDTTRMVMPTVAEGPDGAGPAEETEIDPGATRVVGAARIAEPSRPPRREPSSEPWPDPPPPADRQPPLLDAAQRVDAAMRRFALEPATAVGMLQELDASFAPDPHVLAALGICNYRGGRVERGLELANRAIPMIIERGLIQLAVELFKTMRPHLDRLDLDGDAVLLVAGEMAKSDDLAGAAKAYSAVIGLDAGETRAIKGLLQVAERLVLEAGRPDAAAKVYRYLLAHCASSPLAEFMRSGLEEAEREIERQAETVGG